MIRIYKTNNNFVTSIDKIEPGCWVSVVEPTEQEIKLLIDEYGLDSGFVKSSLDEEESSRVELEDDQTLIIVDSPSVEKQIEETIQYSTAPMGIILKGSVVFTMLLNENVVRSEFASGLNKNVQTHLKTQFILMVLLRIATKFLQCLKQIDKISNSMERQLHQSMKNKELIQLLALEKSLVYFSTSLKANAATLEKINRGRVIKLYEDDQDLIEDVIIEVKQAVDMSGIYSSILNGMMDAYGSIISNNVNFVMKRLTIVTILMEIPNIISGMYGMNVKGLPVGQAWFPFSISLVVTFVTAVVLLKSKKFK